MTTVTNVQFISVWNGGFEIPSNAKWNQATGEITDITTEEYNEYIENNVDDDGDELEILDGQFIEFADGTRLEVVEENDGYYAFSNGR